VDAFLARRRLYTYDRDHTGLGCPNLHLIALLAALPSSKVSRLRLRRGSTVFERGDSAPAVFVVEAGRVRLSRRSVDGVLLILHVADRGESFAEASLSAAHHPCDAIAETDSAVLVVPKADLLASMAADPAQAIAFALALAS
jgi:CRP/FNR family cyclic AMP-dependent transcriptional regulator